MSRRVTGRAPWVVVLVILLMVTGGAIALALQSGAADTTAAIVREIRAPRIVMALIIGIGLGTPVLVRLSSKPTPANTIVPAKATQQPEAPS